MAHKLNIDFAPHSFDVSDPVPPAEGWHKPCEIADHNWIMEIEEGHVNITCTDPCPDLEVYDPSGFTPACMGWWENEDFSTPDPIPVELKIVDDSSPAGPWGPAEYGYWIDVRVKQS